MNPTVKGSLKSKLMWLGAAVSVMGYIQANIQLISNFIPQEYIGAANMALGLAIMIARYFTTESLEDKGTPQ
jgi:hypothetical protein